MKLFYCKVAIITILSCSILDVSFATTRNITLDFRDVEVLTFIKLIGKVTDKTFVFNDKILKGKQITILSNQKFTPEETYKIFESILDINDLSLIDEGNVTRIVDSKTAKISSVQIYGEGKTIDSGSYIIRIIPVRHADIRAIRSNLAPLVSKDAILIANEEADVLILKDTKENTERFSEIVSLIDQPGGLVSSLNLEIIPLTHADATDTSALLTKIFSSPGDKKTSDSARLRILAENRTNSLILIGHPLSLQKLKELIVQLDNKIETDEGNIRVYPLKNANAKKVAEVLQKVATAVKGPKTAKQASATVTIIPDIPSNSLVIFADQADFPTLENVITKLDIERAQVFIQAIIMEVTLDKSLDLGVEWQGSGLSSVGNTDALATIGSVGATGRPKTLESIAGGTGSSGAVFGVIGGPITFAGTQYSTFNAFIKAVEKDSEIDILSNPQILTLNNEEAEIKVGEIIPTVGSSKTDINGNTTTTVDYKEVGISLKITPQINVNNSIELKIDENSSNVIVGKSDALSNQGAITTLNRSLKTTVVVDNNQTIVLGGLISDEITDEEMKTPCLGDIPIIGWLFKTSSSRTRKTNLLVFLTPNVVRNKQELAQVTDKAKQNLKKAMKGRFRIDVSKELDIPIKKKDGIKGMLQDDVEDDDTIETEIEKEKVESKPKSEQ